jgi:adenosylcobinamide-GDP ribazoletransferase
MQVVENLLTETARAVSFLSRLPVPDRYFTGHDGSLSRTVAAFPLAGLIIALPSALLVLILASASAATVLIAIVSITVQVMLTGALHEDGLSDTADGFGGGRTREKVLAIMKDSRIGTYGALALILSITLRVAALSILIDALPPLAAGLSWLAAAVLSRTLMVWHWSSLPPARADGVAASAGAPDIDATRTALILGGAITLILSLTALPFHAWFLAAAVSLSGVAVFTRHCRKRIGGHTGDTIGATQQVCESAFLATLAMFV